MNKESTCAKRSCKPIAPMGNRGRTTKQLNPLRNFNVGAFNPKGLVSAIPQCIATKFIRPNMTMIVWIIHRYNKIRYIGLQLTSFYQRCDISHCLTIDSYKENTNQSLTWISLRRHISHHTFHENPTPFHQQFDTKYSAFTHEASKLNYYCMTCYLSSANNFITSFIIISLFNFPSGFKGTIWYHIIYTLVNWQVHFYNTIHSIVRMKVHPRVHLCWK